MDIERTMQFLLEQQARFAELQARVEEQQARFAEQQDRLAEQQAGHEARQAQFEKDLAKVTSTLLDLAVSHERTNEIMATLAERHVELAEKQKVTEEALHVLIATVERHISGHA